MSVKDLAFKVIPNSYERRQIAISKILQGCDSALDIGCGPAAHMDFEGTMDGVEIYEPYIEQIRKEGTYHDVWKLDVTDLSSIPDKSYDAVVCFHVIEHLTKSDGLKLISEMERIARKRVIVETPNGYDRKEASDDNLHMKHISGWEPYEFELLGYATLGLEGLKIFKGKPILHHLTCRIVENKPSLSLILFSWKEK